MDQCARPVEHLERTCRLLYNQSTSTTKWVSAFLSTIPTSESAKIKRLRENVPDRAIKESWKHYFLRFIVEFVEVFQISASLRQNYIRKFEGISKGLTENIEDYQARWTRGLDIAHPMPNDPARQNQPMIQAFMRGLLIEDQQEIVKSIKGIYQMEFVDAVAEIVNYFTNRNTFDAHRITKQAKARIQAVEQVSKQFGIQELPDQRSALVPTASTPLGDVFKTPATTAKRKQTEYDEEEEEPEKPSKPRTSRNVQTQQENRFKKQKKEPAPFKRSSHAPSVNAVSQQSAAFAPPPASHNDSRPINPMRDVKCDHCGRRGHQASTCWTNPKSPHFKPNLPRRDDRAPTPAVKTEDKAPSSSTSPSRRNTSVNVIQVNCVDPHITTPVQIGTTRTRAIVDSGAQANIMRSTIYDSIRLQSLSEQFSDKEYDGPRVENASGQEMRISRCVCLNTRLLDESTGRWFIQPITFLITEDTKNDVIIGPSGSTPSIWGVNLNTRKPMFDRKYATSFIDLRRGEEVENKTPSGSVDSSNSSDSPVEVNVVGNNNNKVEQDFYCP